MDGNGGTDAMDSYWEAHRIDDAEKQGQDAQEMTGSSKQSDGRRRKNRAQSDAAILERGGQVLSPDHPAMGLSMHLERFGPLIFPLYRAALLRKQILIITNPPVRSACDLGTDRTYGWTASCAD